MPQYEYICERKHITEKYGGYEDSTAICGVCKDLALRRPIYRDQYISAETGPKGGQKVEPPREEKSYRKQYTEYREAAAEIDYAYSRVDDPKVKAPNYYKEGVKQARKRGAKIRG